MVEVQDIFRQHSKQYRCEHKPTFAQRKAMSAIERCRTGELGAHVDVCENCGDTQISYNSCRNRHCPKCQMLSKERWIENRKSDLLNVGYFHVVFTLPSELRPVLYQNQVTLYNVLFRAVAQTLQELAANPKFLGARLGFTSILHTWGQNLSYHPHIHCIIPGGGLDSLGKWRDSRKKFFIPVMGVEPTYAAWEAVKTRCAAVNTTVFDVHMTCMLLRHILHDIPRLAVQIGAQAFNGPCIHMALSFAHFVQRGCTDNSIFSQSINCNFFLLHQCKKTIINHWHFPTALPSLVYCKTRPITRF